MMDDRPAEFARSVHNLLVNCGGCQPGQTVLIIHETEKDGYYDPGLTNALAEVATEMGFDVETVGVPLNRTVSEPDPRLAAQMEAAECTVFLARLGDQLRFRKTNASKRRIVSYALDREMMSSPFGTLPYAAFDALKAVINRAISTATDIRVTCPLGTDFSGHCTAPLDKDGEVTVRRFPVSVFTPVPSHSFAGRIAQNGFLTGTGSNYYSPYTCPLDDTLFLTFDGTAITGFEGQKSDVERAKAHYDHVGALFDIDSRFVHSWHAGIHPGCRYTMRAAENFERWSGGAFGNPRLLHFHTCGAYPPGEISLNILDPTVTLDGVALWDHGRLYPDRIAGGRALLDEFPDMADLFENPARDAGQGTEDRLTAT